MPLNFSSPGAFGSQEANWIKLEELVQAERARDPRLSMEQARARVYATEHGRRYLAAYRAAAKSVDSPEQAADRKSAAWAKIDDAAQTIRKHDPSLSLEAARDQVMKANPNLVASYRGATNERTIGAAPTESDWLRRLEISKSDRSISELAEKRLTELTKAEQARSEKLVKLDPTVRPLTKEQAFVVAVQSPEGREAYEQLRRPDADMSPLQIRQEQDDRINRVMQSIDRQINANKPLGASPGTAPVAKQASAEPAQPVKTWTSKTDSGTRARMLRILLEPGGTAAEIEKAMQQAPESIRFVRDTVFHGRPVKAGTVVGIWPAEDGVAA
jgi:hypothetical protein